jgi:hypothetical protein
MFTDAMFFTGYITEEEKCAHVFCDPSGWARLYPMKNKPDAHEALLSLLFSKCGIPHTMVLEDGAKEQQLGAFHRKAQEASRLPSRTRRNQMQLKAPYES